jgi:hypothetical protein
MMQDAVVPILQHIQPGLQVRPVIVPTMTFPLSGEHFK